MVGLDLKAEYTRRLFERYQEESNRIEGIQSVRPAEADSLLAFAELPELTVSDVTELAKLYTDGYGVLRNQPGMDVRVGDYHPPRGGPDIVDSLLKILFMANQGSCRSPKDAFNLHIAYETLHPLRDGNGRTGRALFLWQELKAGRDRALHLGFLQEWYFRTLECSR